MKKKEFKNGSMRLKVLANGGNKVLFERSSQFQGEKITSFVVAINPIFNGDNVSWDWGHYTFDKQTAIKDFEN